MAIDNQYQSYYTKSVPIVEYMVDMLNIKESDSFFEPCGGDGVFIDELLKRIPNANINVFELNPNAVSILQEKYKSICSVQIKETDTLLDKCVVSRQLSYDKIIGNPPYGARNSEEKKESLNQLYSNLYTKESYTLFLYACIHCLREGGVLSFIIPDTFLSLHRHTAIRKVILNETQIQEIALFPSSFFPGVNFGYANLCIITLKKNSDKNANFHHKFYIRSNFDSVLQLNDKTCGMTQELCQRDIYNNIDSAFFINSSDRINELINNCFIQRIGDIANCVTGFYSGNDKKYLHPISIEQKNAKKYTLASTTQICDRRLTANEIKDGIMDFACFVPIVKGGNRPYIKPNEWYMDWSNNALSEYGMSKKCRFQNSSFYFREGGIAIPMIRSSVLTAALIESRLFDQSIVGIYPYDTSYSYYLLAFFNSNVATKLINAINPTTNNSANYIKKIPFIAPSDELKDTISNYARIICESLKSGNYDIGYYKDRINLLFDNLYQLHDSFKVSSL